jgi:hypothetical protein
MHNIMKLLFLAVAVSALPQPVPQDLVASAPGVLTPEEAAAQAKAAFMPEGFTGL